MSARSTIGFLCSRRCGVLRGSLRADLPRANSYIQPMSEGPLGFAIVGCGRIAARHAQHIDSVGRLVAACDVIPERASNLAGQYDAHSYGCIEEMLRSESKIDVVSVCTPNGLHAAHAVAALRAGCHVLCEKPMAISGADCGAMIQAAEMANRRLFIVKQNRFNPPVVAVKKLIDDGRLGKIF